VSTPAPFDKVVVRRLPRYTLPLAAPVTEGGVIEMPAGDFVQVANGPEVRFVAHLEFRAASGVARGGHYHRIRTEWLTLIRGRLRARFADVERGTRLERVIEAGEQVHVLPGCAHSYLAIEDAAAVECATHAFDPDDAVSYRFD
jgi:dTDP-4-dehydrorhamnose 3,5-epimerase-like enzyme